MSIDKRLERIGFKKIREDGYGAEYERDCGGFTQRVDISHKESGRHILQSYDPNLFDEKGIGNTNVGMTYTEMKLFMKKMRRLGLKS